ncbi:MAG: DUF4115 domain-containing protein [Anaerolineaceae bacterium]|nr:DUF4115 domain-containing protein [Anaerolineaceae bacterium]
MFFPMITVGQSLKRARISKRLTLEKAFETTRIRVSYLQALEADDFSAFPSPAQAYGYLRNYADFLGLDFESLLEELRIANESSNEMVTPMDSPPANVELPPQVALPQQQEEESLPAPKPARPKKKTSKPAADSAPVKSRRGRAKADPEPQPEVVEPPEPFTLEPALEQNIESAAADETPLSEVRDSFWRSWLKRLSSIASIRVTQKMDAPSEASVALPVEADVPQTLDDAFAAPEDLKPSDEIFKEIGRDLSERRIMLNLHLDEIERGTHVKAHYLGALENGAFDELPSGAQTYGMLSNYASFLDLDVDALLLRYADGLQARHRERYPQKAARRAGEPIIADPRLFRSFAAGDLIFGVGMAIFLVGFLVWGINRVVIMQGQAAQEPTAPSFSEILLATPDAALFTPTVAFEMTQNIEPTATIVIPTQNLNVNVQINLIALERTYMRVIVDGKEVFNGRVISGNMYPFEAERQVEVSVGSGAAIRVVYNGRDYGLLGRLGQSASVIYREDDVVTPTALPTQPPTSSFTPTITASPSRTPIPSATPRATTTP